MQVMEHDAQPDDKIAHSVVFEVLRKEVVGYKQSPFNTHQFNGVELK
jgi:dipeptide transport system substrate-binding protein